jgi:OmcA/MtrC family decaheme c-type cytochrome
MTFDSIASVADGVGGFDFTLNFTITKDGVAYVDGDTLPSLDDFDVYVVEYDSVTGNFVQNLGGFPSLSKDNVVSNGDGTYTLTQNLAADPTAFTGGAIVGRLADDRLDIADATAPRMNMYGELASASFPIGDIATYEPAAAVDGCVACHNAPYRKHGNLEAIVAGVPNFVMCKGCHSVDSDGGHPEWQHEADNPLAWANNDPLTPEEETLYAYQRTLMNDVHMSHGMHLPYPQSMQNCATCHQGAQLAQVLDDTNFTGETCQSCHPVRGIDTWPDELYERPHRAPALEYLWQRGADLTFHDITSDCTACHGAGVSQSLTAYHSGYDVNITDPAGVRYADQYTVSIDSVTMTGDLMTVTFSSNDPAIVPELLVSFYGWDSKHFIVGSHERDANPACSGFRPGCKMEYVPESSGGDPNPLFTEDAASAPGAWIVTLDVSALQLTKTDDIPTLIADGVIRRAEIGVTPELNLSDLATPGPDVNVVLKAADATYELGSNQLVADYFKGNNKTVSIDKCNACHDSLASSFHAESGRGGDGIEVCKHCHTTTFPASHMEMASRSIESYVHTIHSFQDFDVDDSFNGRDANGDPIPGYDQVSAKQYDAHIHHRFPHFTITNCESCHEAGTFNVPDQAQSMPGVLQTSFAPLTWYDVNIVDGVRVPFEDPAGRNISSSIPEFVTGPASRACGSCHRAELIKDDKAGDLASFNAHTEAFGTFVENDEDDSVLFEIIDDIMSIFE